MTQTLTYAAPVAETEKWLTHGEAAERLRVSERTVHRYRLAGHLRGYRALPGRRWLYRSEDVEALITGPGSKEGSNGQ